MLSPNTGSGFAQHVRTGVGGIALYDTIYDTSGKPSNPIRSHLSYVAQIRLGRLYRFCGLHHRPT
jgi:hypothetical protein